SAQYSHFGSTFLKIVRSAQSHVIATVIPLCAMIKAHISLLFDLINILNAHVRSVASIFSRRAERLSSLLLCQLTKTRARSANTVPFPLQASRDRHLALLLFGTPGRGQRLGLDHAGSCNTAGHCEGLPPLVGSVAYSCREQSVQSVHITGRELP